MPADSHREGLERPWREFDRDDSLSKSLDTLFPIVEEGHCRVCNEPVADGRKRYCSDRCRDIAAGVQKYFTWTSIRQRILDRDEFTCQECGREDPSGSELAVDHIVPIGAGGHPWADENLQTLCELCHDKKTTDESHTLRPEPTLSEFVDAELESPE